MAKYDAEDLLESILLIMTENDALNSRIESIEAEKSAAGKGVTGGLKPIKDYYLQTWTEKMLQKTPAIFYGIEDVQSQDGGGAVAKTYKIFVEVVMVDSGQYNDSHKRISRYARALEEIFCESFDQARQFGKVKVDSIRPFAFKIELDSDDECKVGGVSLTIPLF